ncbi:MAG: helix-turn-helix transcriptional regulator [Lachnospiraceae bacterium]|nr:helix-turn-helix transcriptional regulator [Lachnospiraceae bacterium]
MVSKVKEYRIAKGITQKELGEIVNVSRQAIIAIEMDKYDPSIWLAYDLAKYFGVTIEELFEFKESERK